MNQPPPESQTPASSEASKTPTTKPWEHAKAEGSEGDPFAAAFVESLSYDTRIYRQDIRGSKAHADMLRRIGLLNDEEHRQIHGGLDEIHAEIDQRGNLWHGWRVELEDVHMCIEAALIEKIGDAGRKLHTGRSRNDQVALDLKLWIKDATLGLHEQFDGVLQALVDLAEQQGQILMPAYTHLQRAQPIALGGELMAWAETLDRAKRRLDTLLEGVVMENPLGSGAVAGSSLPLDRLATAEALGVGPPTANAIDATSSRDAAIDFVYGLSMLMMSLSRWAEQWILYASTEFGFLKLDGRYTTGSSMMPQKQNPDMLELIRGRCGNVYGQLMSLLTMCKGLPLGYNRDLQEDKRLLFAAYDTAMGCLQMARRIIQTAHFDQERIEAGLDRGFLDATSLAEYLVQQGVPFRTAHQWVGQAVRLCQERGLSRLNDLSLAQLQSAAQASGLNPDCVGASVYDWLGAANVVRRYRSPGNAGLGGLQEQLEAWRTRLGRR